MKNRLLAKTDQLLRAVVLAETPPSLHELSEALQIPLATLGRLAADLVEMGLLAKEDYYHLVPAPGLAVLGDAAKENNAIAKRCGPLIRDFSSATGMNALLAVMEYGKIFSLCDHGGAKVTRNTLWSTGAALMLYAATDPGPEKALAAWKRIRSGASAEEELIFEREWEQAKRESFLLHTNTMRQWSFCTILTRNAPVSALLVYGKGPEKITLERFHFDSSLLASKLRMLLE